MATPSWNYEDQEAWGKVKGWEVASSGKRQSPIDIDTHLVRTNKHLKPLVLQVRISASVEMNDILVCRAYMYKVNTENDRTKS